MLFRASVLEGRRKNRAGRFQGVYASNGEGLTPDAAYNTLNKHGLIWSIICNFHGRLGFIVLLHDRRFVMKNMVAMLLLPLLAFSIPLYAQDPTSVPDDETQLLTWPKHLSSGLPFSIDSNEDGVCVALGYERAAAGSSRTDGFLYNTILVDTDGIVVGGPSAKAISQMVCVNFLGISIKEKSVLLRKPVHQGSNLPFSTNSNEDGVCVALGYERAAANSSRTDGFRYNAILVDDEGLVIGGPVSKAISQIVCMNSSDKVQQKEKSTLVVRPKHDASRLPFSTASDEHGICIALGFEKAAQGSSRTDGYRYDTIQVDTTGKVVGGPRSTAVGQIVCLQDNCEE